MVNPVCVVSKQAGNSSDQMQIHSLPCKIEYNGPAQVSGYFTIHEDSNGKKRAAFRGHGLEGMKLDLPPNYELCILKKRDNGVFDIESRQKSFTLWEWDREADKRSTMARALSQLRVAHALADD
ncbi:unnamed protein product [Strongylus vulgaris]|uniref:Uncharacterized protein n=1 Tax=Strongylus vulgaris TaxID=40348 RepID=A0A3P7IRG2_STRVU|nr:unnamed protein product [Strongylus vulgaris]